MDEESDDSGFGGLAWYALGRMSAENDRVRDESVDTVLRNLRRRPTVDVNQLLANNQALAAENAQLRRELADYKHNYNRLRNWSKGAEQDLKTLHEQLETCRKNHSALREWADGAERTLEQLGALKD